jgi:glycosyltransferase involved in cell wall biosynthesis
MNEKSYKYDLTINMIVKNEEKIIEPTLKNINDIMKSTLSKQNVELVIVDGHSTDSTSDLCMQYTQNVYKRNFDTFQRQRNYANEMSQGRMIFSIDADELIGEGLEDFLLKLCSIEIYQQIPDVIFVPRINIVNNITDEYIKQVGWKKDNEGHINYPDYQPRIMKNKEHIKWVGNVHETFDLKYITYGYLPHYKDDKLFLIHIKDFERQKKQNNFYASNF